MEWTHFQKPNAFSLDHPVGWSVQTLPGPTVVVASPDRQALAYIQPLHGPATGEFSPVKMIENGTFMGYFPFPGATIQISDPGPENSQFIGLNYKTPNGAVGWAQLAYMPNATGGMLCAVAATQTEFQQIEPTLTRIIESFRQPPATVTATAPAPIAPPAAKASPPLPPLPPLPAKPKPGPPLNLGPMPGLLQMGAPLAFTKFTDPQAGSFTCDVPAGWKIRGGLAHPMPGDRRAWIEAVSPDGIYVLCDPAFPQCFCHFPAQPEGHFTQLAAGGAFLNLKPSADRAADNYIQFVASRRLQGAKTIARKPRPDIVELVQKSIKLLGIPLSKKSQCTAVQIDMQLTQAGQPRIATVQSMAFFNGEYMMGMWAFWNATLYLTISPQHLVARAEEATMRMISSFQNTPKMFQIVQQDEAMITANSQAANAAQWSWFGAQQSAHNAQTAAGNAYVNNYWSQQQANDSLLQGWQQNQAVYDHISQERSDAMLDHQRLADDGQGKEYTVAAGANFYWLNPQTGDVIGTTTSTPPDYQNNYTQLRKL